MRVLEDNLFNIDWNEQHKCVEVTFKGFLDGDTFRTCMEQGLRLVKQKKGRRFLADFRRGSVISESDTLWLRHDWMPRASSAGLLHYAVILPERIVAQMQLQRMKRNADSNPALTEVGVQSMLFTDPEAAYTWLENLR